MKNLEEVLVSNGYKLEVEGTMLRIISKSNTHIIWVVLAMILAVLIVISGLAGDFRLALFPLMLFFLPFYQLVKHLQRPKRIEISDQAVLLTTVLGHRHAIDRSDIDRIIIDQIHEHQHASPFRETVDKEHHLLELLLQSGQTYVVLKLSEISNVHLAELRDWLAEKILYKAS